MNDTDHMNRRQAEKDAAIADIGEALRRIDEAGRQPDYWERVNLVYALASCFRGCYGLARTECRCALTPVNERSQDPNLPEDAIFEKADLQLLKRVLRAAIDEPVREFPHLGPIIFN